MTIADGDGLKIRTDLEVPVMQFETESDVTMLGFYPARQPDTDLIRTWEVAGTAHADQYLASRITEAEIPENVPFGAEMFTCENGNKGPQYIVLRAALKSLNRWVKDGVAPPTAEQIEMKGPQLIIRDEYGNARGGIRTPDVDVPISTLKPIPAFDGSGSVGGCGGQTEDGNFDRTGLMCAVFGGTAPFSEETLLELYPTHADYVTKFKASAEATVAAGFMLEEEAAAITATAEAAPIPN